MTLPLISLEDVRFLQRGQRRKVYAGPGNTRSGFGCQVPSTALGARIVDNALRLHILPTLGGHIGAVRRSHVQALIKELEAKGLSAGSVRNIYEVTALLVNAAAEPRHPGDTMPPYRTPARTRHSSAVIMLRTYAHMFPG